MYPGRHPAGDIVTKHGPRQHDFVVPPHQVSHHPAKLRASHEIQIRLLNVRVYESLQFLASWTSTTNAIVQGDVLV